METMTKCGPILDRVKQEVYESVSIDIDQTTVQTTDSTLDLEKRVAHLERDNANVLNADAENFLPSKSQPIYKNLNPMSESSSSDKTMSLCVLPNIMGYIRHGAKKTKVRILLDTSAPEVRYH